MKIHELAKELNVESKAITEFLEKEGVEVKSHMSNVPESKLNKIKENFGKKEPVKPAEVKAVALPEKFLKKAEEDAKAREQAVASKPEAGKDNKEGAASSETVKKKKKMVGVFNPQYSASLKPKPQAGQTKPARPAEQQGAKRPLPSQVRPARDRKPDDYVEPVKEVKPVQPEKQEEKPVQKPEVKTPEKPAIRPSERHAERNAARQAQAPVPKQPEKPKPQVKPEADKSKESEAIKSLRAKIVKGTVNPDDLLVSTPKPQKGQNGRNNDNNRPKGQFQNRNNNNDKKQGGFNKDRDENTNSSGNRQSQGRNNNQSSNMGGGAPENAKGKGKGGKTPKGKYDKGNHGDKFDRLENEKAAQRTAKQAVVAEQEETIKVITLPESIELKDFASKLKMQPAALIKELFLKGKMYTVNDILTFEEAEEIAIEKEIICEHEVVIDYIEELLKEEEDPEETLVKRPRVVCIMGHVDHGKTSLLDAIRNTNVTAREAGGITQHIGAYTVEINGESITFLDTPGHEAFTAMRLRGAQSTDVAILVVAADDGVMPQTVEAINHARAAGIHVIVAVNKIDKPAANIDKVKQELADRGLIPEDWGGDTIFVPVSAKTGEGIETLLEMVILDTEILELRANPNRKARGIVIEAKLDKGRGSVATLLVQKGTLKVGDHVAIGESYGKVRAMLNDKGQNIKTALPSTPVEITGLSGVPNAGEVFVAFDSDKEAKQFSAVYVAENKKKLLAGSKNKKMSLDDVFDQMKAGELKELNIIVKADVQGSVEAIKESLEKLSNDEIVVKCIHSGAGNVSESDAILASASNAIIIAFNVGVNPDARDTIEHENVDMRTYSVIYNAIDDVEMAMKGMLEPIYEEVVIGHVEVRQTFKASGIGIIAGSYVLDGIVKRNAKVRLSRAEEQIYEGSIASLKRFNDDAKEVKSGFECGIVLQDFQDIKEGDVMEVYEMKEVPRV